MLRRCKWFEKGLAGLRSLFSKVKGRECWYLIISKITGDEDEFKEEEEEEERSVNEK